MMENKPKKVLIKEIMKLKKGKPPLVQPYYGKEAEIYLNPEYLRGKSTAIFVKPGSTAVKTLGGDILVLWDGSNAGEFFISKKGIVPSTMCLLIHSDLYRKDFLYYALKNCEAFLKGQTSGSGIPHVDKEVLEKIDVLQFDELEQLKIAEILSTLDCSIEQLEAIITKQKRMKIGLMQDLLTKGIDGQGNIRTEETHEFKDSLFGRIPVEWDVTIIDNIAEFVTSGSRGWAKYYSAEGDLFLRIGNLTREHINLKLDDVMYVQPTDTSEGKRTAIKTGDILISITADLGIIGVIPESMGVGYVNQHIALVRPLEKIVNPRFIGWFLSCNMGQNQFDAGNESGAKAGLNLTTVRKLRIPVVDIEEQNRIAMVLDQSAQVIDNYIKDLNKLKHLKTALMQDLLTGKKRVTSLLKEMR